jgi:carbonic anhydrase
MVGLRMDRLIAGYRKFRETVWPERRAAYEELAEHGQKPLAMVIACSDSRLDPSLIFGVPPGGLFVVRNVANLVPPYQPDAAYHGTSAALEFAVRSLEVPEIVVMGHALCGGVTALLHGVPDTLSDFVGPWVQIARRAQLRVAEAVQGEEAMRSACEHETVRVSLENLMTFPWIAERVADGRLRLQGAYYQISTGVLEVLGEDGNFAPVE